MSKTKRGRKRDRCEGEGKDKKEMRKKKRRRQNLSFSAAFCGELNTTPTAECVSIRKCDNAAVSASTPSMW